jgi:hypothetical protein
MLAINDVKIVRQRRRGKKGANDEPPGSSKGTKVSSARSIGPALRTLKNVGYLAD